VDGTVYAVGSRSSAILMALPLGERQGPQKRVTRTPAPIRSRQDAEDTSGT
jgi:hypothetical protein